MEPLMQEMLTFDDVLIKPRFSDINSRKDVNLTSPLGYRLPIVSANMDTITEAEMACAMIKLGGQGCLHRFWSIESNCNAFLKVTEATGDVPWVSVGISDKERERAEALLSLGANTIVIDVAHAAQMQVVNFHKWLYPKGAGEISIIVGNFGNLRSVEDYCEHLSKKPDAIKVGIGPGSACTTRLKTGCGVPQLSAIMDCVSSRIPIIADGGMRNSGDIAKALAAGAKMVMLGGMLAGTDETPGEIIKRDKFEPVNPPNGLLGTWTDEIIGKKYRGSASKEAYEEQGKDWDCAEGESFIVDYKGPVEKYIKSIEGGLRSAFTYVGAENMEEFHKRAEFVKVSSNSVKENGAHGQA